MSKNLLIVALLVVILNVPFGFWRAGLRKFSFSWFLAVHAPVPAVVGLRFLFGLALSLATFPVLVTAYFMGQFLGAQLRKGLREKNMTFLRLLYGVFFCATLSTCTTMDIHSDYDPSMDFSRLKTYAWLERPASEIDDPRVHDEFLASRVRLAVERELVAKGYRKPTSGQPDFLVGYHAAIEKKIDTYKINRTYTQPTYPGNLYRPYRYPNRYPGRYPSWTVSVPETRVREYDLGTLVLDIIDGASQGPIWRGSAQAEVNFSADPEKRQQRINEAVRRILERFPPTPKVP